MYTMSAAGAERRLIPNTRAVSYRGSSPEEKLYIHNLLAALWVGDKEEVKRCTPLLDQHGFDFERWDVEGHLYSVVREKPKDRRGAGIYVIRDRPAPDKAILLQAPHAYFDKRTGSIAAKIFFEQPSSCSIRGLFVSSVHRYQVEKGVKKKNPDSEADICHNVDHLYTIATAAVLGQGIDTLIVQLHGFIDTKSTEGRLDAIISSGAKESTPSSIAMAASLAQHDLNVLRYPEETNRLGGTKNIQVLLTLRTEIRFIHVELEKLLRNKLHTDKETRKLLYDSMIAGLNA